MTREEAIEVLEEVKMLDDSMFAYSQVYNDALDMAIKALKAQEPKKPNKAPGRWTNVYHCGACGKLIGEVGGNKINFCCHCGKAVKWE